MKTWKKILLFTFATAILVITTTGCVTVNFSNGSYGKKDLNGKGDKITTEFTASGYSSVEVDANVDIIYSNTPSDIIKAEIQQNLLDHLTVTVKNDRLYISSDRNFITNSSNKPKLYISADSLTEILVESEIHISGDTLKSDSLRIQVFGICNGSLDIDCKNLAITVGGISDITLSGQADTADFSLTGMGTIDAFGLKTNTSSVTITGDGEVNIHALDTLNATISGIGTIRYKGEPSLSKNIGGLGTIEQAA